MKNKKVLVSGCYDLLHGGHIAFFKTAAAYGELYVSIGRDENLLTSEREKACFFRGGAIIYCEIGKICK